MGQNQVHTHKHTRNKILNKTKQRNVRFFCCIKSPGTKSRRVLNPQSTAAGGVVDLMQRLFPRHSLTTSLYDLAAESPAVIRASKTETSTSVAGAAPPPCPPSPTTSCSESCSAPPPRATKKSKRRRCGRCVRGASGRLFATSSSFLHFNDSLQPLFSCPITHIRTSIKRKGKKKREGAWSVRTRRRRSGQEHSVRLAVGQRSEIYFNRESSATGLISTTRPGFEF